MVAGLGRVQVVGKMKFQKIRLSPSLVTHLALIVYLFSSLCKSD
jgi:hypothetical protein